MDADVLVVGAGPTGLALAGDLARAGVYCTLLERRTDEPNTTRAFAVHARTLEQLDARGIADELVATGATVPGVRLFNRARIDLSRLPTRYPYLLVTPQYETERVLARRAVAPYVTTVRGAELASIGQDRDGVTAILTDGRTFRARYLVGCDGVHSAVRSSLGLPFPGRSAVRSIMLADVRFRNEPADLLTVNSAAGAFAFIAPFGDGWYRVFAWNGDDLPDSAPVDLEAVRSATRRALGTDYGMHDPRWLSRFHSDERQAPRYRVGRVFLAGDAAHCHSPAGGMGMNTGIQDATNLGWKLAIAVQDRAAGDGILDSYESERHPVGRLVLRASGAMVRAAIVRSATQRALRTTAAYLALRLPPVGRRAALVVSGIGIGYRDGADRVPDQRLRDGRRLYESLRDGRFAVLGQPALDVTPWSRASHVRPAAATDRVTLVRPDGYAAWSGPAADVAGLRHRLDRWCGAATTAGAPAGQP